MFYCIMLKKCIKLYPFNTAIIINVNKYEKKNDAKGKINSRKF